MPGPGTDLSAASRREVTGSETRRHVVLAGGGHSHVHVLRSLAMRPEADTRFTVVTPARYAVYSGMVPGRLVGAYDAEQVGIDVAALAARAGARFLPDRVVRVDAQRRVIETAARGEIPYDLLSLDVGSRPRKVQPLLGHPGVVGVKPVEEAASRIERFLADVRKRREGRVVVVGAGSGGVEVAFALRHELPAAPAGGVAIVEAADTLLPAGSRRLRGLVADLTAQYGIETYTGRRFDRFEEGHVHLDDGSILEADLVLWATGAEGLPFLRESGLPVDGEGFVLVDDTLRCTSAPEVFAVGDCARMVSHPAMPRAGVFAVRQGPILEENLRRALRERPPIVYRPQKDFLSLLSTGDGRAVMSYYGRAGHGTFWWRLKDWIDRRFMEKYARPTAMALRRGPEVAETMPMEACGGCAAKVDPDMLIRTLRALSPADGPGVAIGLAAPDDAAVLAPPAEGRLVFTVDAFPPFLSDPLLVGEVAALNALSDVWAMGGRPTAALALVGVDPADGESREADLRQMMLGARGALDRLGVPLAGGHSIETASPIIGFAVVGGVAPEGTMTKAGARRRDILVLTKALGTGVVLAATRAGECPAAWTEATIESMRRANDVAARLFSAAGVRACTDVSGFGLAGHLGEMLAASRLAADVWAAELPALPGALELLEHDWRSSADEGLRAAREIRTTVVDLPPDDPRIPLLRDPQTSGGLVAAVSESVWPALRDTLAAAGVSAVAIGVVTDGPPGALRLVPRRVVAGRGTSVEEEHERRLTI